MLLFNNLRYCPPSNPVLPAEPGKRTPTTVVLTPNLQDQSLREFRTAVLLASMITSVLPQMAASAKPLPVF